MQVTRIEPFDKRRYKIYLNDEFAFVVYRGELSAYSIEEGQELSDAARREIMDKVLKKRARKRALHLLEKSEKTEKQLREKLQQSLYPPEAVEDAVDYVKSYRYVDDRAYAEKYAEAKRGKKSRRQIGMELISKGIDRDTVREALESGSESEEELAASLILRKYPDITLLDQASEKKLYGYLLRKGFSSEDICAGLHKAKTNYLT